MPLTPSSIQISPPALGRLNRQIRHMTAPSPHRPFRASKRPARATGQPSGPSPACARANCGTGSMSMAPAISPPMTNLAKDFRAALAESFSLARPEIVTEQISEDGTRKWLLRTGARHRIRDRLHPGRRPRHALRLLPGRLHAQLPLLPHRHAEAGQESHALRNRRPADGGARRARRLAVHRSASRKSGCRFSVRTRDHQ